MDLLAAVDNFGSASLQPPPSQSQAPEEREALLAVARLDAVIEGARDAIVRLSPDLKIQSWNRAAQQLFDFEEEVVLEDFVDIVAGENTRAAFLSWLSSADQAAGPPRLEHELLTRKGVMFIGECSVAERYRVDDDVTVFVRDLTTTRRLEAEVRQSQKLDAVARLASGMAHEINTPLQYMNDNIEFLTRSVASLLAIVNSIQASAHAQPTSALSVDIDAITKKAKLDYLSKSVPSAADETLEGLTHINKIVRAMKGLAGPAAGFGGGQVDFKETIESTINVATNQYKQSITVVTDIHDHLPELSCGLGEIAQVVLALVTNSVQAIADKSTNATGTIQISMIAEDGESGSVVLRVSDDGCGIPPENIHRVFDPFFTTRPLGKGLGQGLTEVHSIVVSRGHGHVAIESRVGEGTTITAKFPRVA